MTNYNFPTYCPNAIATDKGWVDPKTGELLVLFRGLKSLILDTKNNPKPNQKEPEILIEVIPEFENTEILQDTPIEALESTPVESKEESNPEVPETKEIVPEAPKKKRGRPAKVKV